MAISAGTYLNAFPVSLPDPQPLWRIAVPVGGHAQRRELERQHGGVRLFIHNGGAWTAQSVEGAERVSLPLADAPQVHLFNLREALRNRASNAGWEFWAKYGEMNAVEPGPGHVVEPFAVQPVLKMRVVWEGVHEQQVLLVGSSSVRWLVTLPLSHQAVQAAGQGETVVRRLEAHGRIRGQVTGFAGEALVLAGREGGPDERVVASDYQMVARPALVFRLLEELGRTHREAADLYSQLLVESRTLLPNRKTPNNYAAKQRFEETERLLNEFGREIELPNGTAAVVAGMPQEVYEVPPPAEDPWTASKMASPKLRFDAAIPSRSDTRAFQGLRKFGAYAADALPQPPHILLAFPSAAHAEADRFGRKLLEGSGNYLGFQQLFGLPDEQAPTLERLPLPAGPDARNLQRLREALDRWAASQRQSEPQLAIVIVPHTDRWEVETPYYVVKEFFGARGIPSQVVTVELLHDTGRLTWSLANIALAAFAKLGGVPWVVDARGHDGDLVVGVGRANVQVPGGARRRIFGYAVAFVANGAYLATHSFPPAADEDEYEEKLKDAIVAALSETRDWDQPPERIVIHLPKRTGRRELAAAEAALAEAGQNLPYALVRIDDSSLYELLDGSSATYAAPKGLTLRLSDRRALVQVEGQTDFGPARRPLLVELDGKSTVGSDQFGSLVLQVYRLGHANWRGFNARSKPVTLFYGERLAELVGYLAQRGVWDPGTMPPELRDRPWFL